MTTYIALKRTPAALKISALSTTEHQLLSGYLRGVEPKSLSETQRAARDSLTAQRLLRKSTDTWVATKKGAALLDSDSRCLCCSKEVCGLNGLPWNAETIRQTRAMFGSMKSTSRAA